MLLCLDVGNTHIFGGLFVGDKLQFHFRHATHGGTTSDQMGVFIKSVLRENNFNAKQINAVALCSVVPSLDYSLRAACKKYLQIDPFILHAGITTGITIKTKNPGESGADIVAGLVAATHFYPHKNLIVFDLGTVTTIAAVTKNKEFLGASFIAGIHTSMNALQKSAAKLFPVEILKPKSAIGCSTAEAVQSGLYFGHLGAIKEIAARITAEAFIGEKPLLVATGGFAHLFSNGAEDEKIFDFVEADLILQGIRLTHELNNKNDE